MFKKVMHRSGHAVSALFVYHVLIFSNGILIFSFKLWVWKKEREKSKDSRWSTGIQSVSGGCKCFWWCGRYTKFVSVKLDYDSSKVIPLSYSFVAIVITRHSMFKKVVHVPICSWRGFYLVFVPCRWSTGIQSVIGGWKCFGWCGRYTKFVSWTLF